MPTLMPGIAAPELQSILGAREGAQPEVGPEGCDANNERLPGNLGDLNMLVNPGGTERTREEWERVLFAGGFGLSEVHPTRGMYSVLESSPA